MASKKSRASLMDMLSFIAVIVGGIGLVVSKLLTGKIVAILSTVSNMVGWFVLCLLSFNYIKNRKNIWMWLVWGVAVIMIVLSVFL